MSSTSSQGGERGEGIVDIVAAGRVISAQHQQDDSMTTANNNNNNNNITITSKKSVSSSTSYYTTNRSTTSSGRPYTRTSSFHSAMSGITTATEDFASCVEQESDIDSMESMNDNTTNKFSIIMESIHDNDDNNDDDDSHNSRSNNNNRRDVQKGKCNYNCNDKNICISEEEEEVIEKDGIQRIVDRIPTEKKATTATSIPIVITVDDNDNSIDSDNSAAAAAASAEDNKEDKEEDDDNDNDDDGEEEFNNTNHIRQQTHLDQSQKHQQIVAKDDATTPITNKYNVNNKNTNEKQLEATKLIYTKSKAIISWGKSIPVVSLFVKTTETVASVIASTTCNTSLQQLDTQIETYLVPTIDQRIITPIVKTINTGNTIVRVFLSPFLVATKLLENKTTYDEQTTINEETMKATTTSKPPQPAVAAARYYFTSTDIEQETNYMFKY